MKLYVRYARSNVSPADRERERERVGPEDNVFVTPVGNGFIKFPSVANRYSSCRRVMNDGAVIPIDLRLRCERCCLY